MIGYDGSKGSRAALRQAVDIAKLDGSRLVIVFGYEIPAAYGGGETGDYRRELKRMAEDIGQGAEEEMKDTGVDFEVALVPKRPVEALLDTAEEHHARMIATGTRGEHPLTGAILGSVPHKLLHASSLPMLIVPAPHED